jgi:hypothetical protein
VTRRLRHRAAGAFNTAALVALPATLLILLFGGGGTLRTVLAKPAAAPPEETPPPPAEAQPMFDFPGPVAVAPARAADAASPASVDPLTMQPAMSSVSALLDRERYEYRSVGRRDPFRSLLSGRYLRGQAGDLLDIADIRLVGIMWSRGDRSALVEDSRGFGYVLRVGDPVRNGVVIDIDEDALTVEQTLFGQTEIISIPMKRQEGEGHE